MTWMRAPRARLGATLVASALGAIVLLAVPALAAAKDRNHDRIPDRWERRHELRLSVDQARRDQDHDHLRNRAEFLAGDNPRDRDSDDDGLIDGSEQAGTIASFDEGTGRLVIDLFGGDTIAGLVTDQTRIECEDEGPASTASSEGRDGGEAEPGDDHGDDGIEVGDDSGNSGPSSNSGPGSGEESDDNDDRLCTAAALVPGAVVEEAELEIGNGRATFEEVELSGKED